MTAMMTWGKHSTRPSPGASHTSAHRCAAAVQRRLCWHTFRAACIHIRTPTNLCDCPANAGVLSSSDTAASTVFMRASRHAWRGCRALFHQPPPVCLCDILAVQGSDQIRQAFSKRKKGLVLKAYQLNALTDAKVGSLWRSSSCSLQDIACRARAAVPGRLPPIHHIPACSQHVWRNL
jgi:hypothetical protein